MTLTPPDVIDRAWCVELDAHDPLARFRDRFDCDDDLMYLDGNSLGRLPRATPQRLRTLVEQEWGRGLVRGWTESGWMHSPRRLGDKIARLIGAGEDEVLVTDTTSVDIFKVATAALMARPQRPVILTEPGNFPTDLYSASGIAALLPHVSVRRVQRHELRDALDAGVGLLLLTHVDFRTGERHDMRGLTAAARDAGALALWDLSHSTGAIPLDLARDGVELAVGCGYKYLNGGPGAPAFLHVTRALQHELANPVRGWLGHESPFTFETEYRAASGIRQWLSGSPPVMGIAALEVAVDMFLEVERHSLAEKAASLTELFIRLADARLAAHGFEVITPREPERRGAQVSLRHDQGYPIMRALIARGAIGDFRDPDVCRFGFAPLYTRYIDVWDAVEHMAEVVSGGEHRNPEHAQRGFIT